MPATKTKKTIAVSWSVGKQRFWKVLESPAMFPYSGHCPTFYDQVNFPFSFIVFSSLLFFLLPSPPPFPLSSSPSPCMSFID